MSACGRVGFADGAGSDAPLGADGRACTFGPFSTPNRLAGAVNAAGFDDWTPSISDDALTLFFYSQRPSAPGVPDIWIATRSTTTAAFGAAAVLAEVSSSSRDTFPRPSADGLALYLSSNRPSGALSDFLVATRPTASSLFGTPALMSDLSSPSDDEGLAISRDGLRVVFASNRDGGYALYQAERPNLASPFSNIRLIDELNSTSNELAPSLSHDDLELVFVSDRPGGAGGYDIWRATRSSVALPFATPENVAPVNSARDEFGPFLSSDGTTLYLAHDAAFLGGADADVWIATRSCL